MDNDDSLQEHIKQLITNYYKSTPISPIPFKDKYIQPETDKQGNIYGYKVLVWRMDKEHFISPLYMTAWENGELKSDKEPSDLYTHGIYFMKRVYDAELETYVSMSRDRYIVQGKEPYVFIVRCVLSGVIVEGERGFRSEYAKITEVLRDGYWQDYQNFQEEAQYY